MEYIIKSSSYRLLKKKINELVNGIDKDNITYYDLSIDSLKDILSDCNYVSLFDEKKAIIVYNTNIFSTKFEYKEECELLESYLSNPNKNTVLIFISDSVSTKKKCAKMIKDNIIELSVSSLEDEVKLYIKELGFKIENSALTKLINNLNSNYDFILNELDKIMVVKKDYLITLDDVNKYSLNLEKNDIFDFVDVVIKKEQKKIFKYLEEYINNKEEPAILFSNIATQYRLIYCVKNLMKDGYTEKSIATELNIHPYRVKLAVSNSYNYSNKELKEKLLSIVDLDEKIKLGLIDKYNALKMFLVNI